MSADITSQNVHIYEPSPEVVSQAAVSGMAAYQALCREAEQDYTGYWARLAADHVSWQTPFTQVLDEIAGEVTEGDTASQRHLIEMLVQRRDGPHAILAGAQGITRMLIAHAIDLHVQQAGDDLKMVFDAVMRLAEHQLLTLEVDHRPALARRSHHLKGLHTATAARSGRSWCFRR